MIPNIAMRKDSKKFDLFQSARTRPPHPLDWVFEPLEEHPAFTRRKIFGCEAAYLKGRLSLVLAAGEEPWNGLLVATCREFHESMQAEWPQLAAHTVLGKWLYVSQDNPAFETVALKIARRAVKGDTRIGVDPQPKKRKKGAHAKPQSRKEKKKA